MSSVPNFILFAVERSGSTNLSHILSTHRDITCISEPFNASSGLGAHLTADSHDTLRAHLDMLRATYTGFKHVWHADGWPLPDPSFTKVLLLYGRPKVIYLDRRNLLQQAVSHHLAAQTNVWSVQGSSDPRRKQMKSLSIAPIDPQWMADYLSGARQAADRYRTLLTGSGVEWFDLCYENLFGESMDGRARMQMVAQILRFLGAGEIDVEAGPIARLLSPSFAKINSASTYRRIPNIAEIEREFGNAENGVIMARAESIPAFVSGPMPVKPSSPIVDPAPSLTPKVRIAVQENQIAYLRTVAQQQSQTIRSLQAQLSAPAHRAAHVLQVATDRARGR